ncbi:MAG: exodeoxyribonuclease VII large subunit [Synergistaceae bacterium]|nr:exodeoxyribonuclease VII large subunit [Synergistaceae bacterium]
MPRALPNLTVDELNQRVQLVIQSDPVLENLAVTGEILDFKVHRTGHAYFTLVGKESRLACVMFRSHAESLPEWPRTGDLVVVEGSVSVYLARGAYQLYARRLLPAGQGAQARAREELRRRLQEEGLFDPRNKRPLPRYPESALVLTSPTGAAVRDVLRVSRSRFPACSITVIPCNVQGEDAVSQILKAFARAGKLPKADVALLVRGGGSRDDLNASDDERVVRAVRSCPIPVVTGLGHEIDQTFSDLAADAAAPTPSAAAEKVFPDRRAVSSDLASLRRHAAAAVSRRIEEGAWLAEKLRGRLASVAERRLAETETGLENLGEFLGRSILSRIDLETHRLASLVSALEALSPVRVLSRGYISCETPEGRPVVSARSVETGDRLRLVFPDGRLGVRVEESESYDQGGCR